MSREIPPKSAENAKFVEMWHYWQVVFEARNGDKRMMTSQSGK